MWIFLGLLSAFCLGFYDVFKKVSLKGNNVPVVLLLNTMFGTLLLSPVLIESVAQGHYGPGDTLMQNLLVVLKAVIVLSSWILGYFAIKHLPLTIQGPINASRPVLVLLGALLIFGERLNALQWCGMLLGFASLFFISRIGAKEGFSFKASIWLWMSIGATMLGAVSALYDKFLMGRFQPLQVQAWYSFYQMLMMGVVVLILYKFAPAHFGGKFKWRWSILGISVFLLPHNSGCHDFDCVHDATRQRDHTVPVWSDSAEREERESQGHRPVDSVPVAGAVSAGEPMTVG